MSVNVPATLLKAPPLVELTKQQKNDFLNRLDFIAEIPSRFRKGVGNGKTTRELLDDLELDVVISLATPSENQNDLTAYFTHTSWASEVGAEALAGSLDDEVRKELFRGTATPSDIDSFRSLVERELATLETLAGLVEKSTMVERFLAHLFGIDCVLSRLLHITYTMRLLSAER